MALPLLNGDATTSDMGEPFKTLGRFRLVELIGRGGMGEVWLGVDPDGMERRAIKVLLPDVANNPRVVESFRREAEIGKQLSLNSSIVGVHGIDEAFIGDPACPERVLFLVLDFVDGVNLRQFAERYYRAYKKRLPIPVVVHILRAMLRAIDAAHSHAIGPNPLPVVHGDVNPGNVLIASRGEVRMTDFGISRFAPEPVYISRPVGTLPYMAPEQYLGRICPQNDLYSVGAVLHELLTGRPPTPQTGTPVTIERRLLQDPIPPLGRDDVPEALERLRRSLLEKDASLRIQTAIQALKMLKLVDESDRQDEIKAIYRRLFGPPRSRMTRYLQARGEGEGSFVMQLLSRHERPVTTDAPVHEPQEERGSTEPASTVIADEDEGGMPWLAEEDDDEESFTTQVHHRSGPRLSPTIRLDLPVGGHDPVFAASTPTVPEPPPVSTAEPGPTPPEPKPEGSGGTRAAGPLPSPTEHDSDAHAVTTTPYKATTAAKPTPDPRRYPPRPPHLADGVPFQLRRPKRGAPKARTGSDVAPAAIEVGTASEPEPAVRRRAVRADSATGPQRTRPQRSPDTQPDAPSGVRVAARPRRPSEGSTARRLRSLVVTTAAVLLVACGIGMVALAFAEPDDAIASPDPHPAAMATTEATTDG